MSVKPLHIIVMVDASGSMGNVQVKIVKGLNKFIRSIQQAKNVYFSLAFFHENLMLRYVMMSSHNVPPLEYSDYCPASITALYDSVGTVIDYFVNRNIDANHVMFIITDGYDNMSRLETRETLAQKMNFLQQSNWRFIHCSPDLNQLSMSNVSNVEFNKDEVDDLLEGLSNIRISTDDTTVDDLIGKLSNVHVE